MIQNKMVKVYVDVFLLTENEQDNLLNIFFHDYELRKDI